MTDVHYPAAWRRTSTSLRRLWPPRHPLRCHRHGELCPRRPRHPDERHHQLRRGRERDDRLQLLPGRQPAVDVHAGRELQLPVRRRAPARLRNQPVLQTTSWSYLDNNWLPSQSLANGVASAVTLNARGQLLDVTHQGTGGVLSEFGSLLHDGAGNLRSVTAAVAGQPTYSGLTSFQYDARGQLLQEQSARAGGYTNTHAYDAAGNPTTFPARRTPSTTRTSLTGGAHPGEPRGRKRSLPKERASPRQFGFPAALELLYRYQAFSDPAASSPGVSPHQFHLRAEAGPILPFLDGLIDWDTCDDLFTALLQARSRLVGEVVRFGHRGRSGSAPPGSRSPTWRILSFLRREAYWRSEAAAASGARLTRWGGRGHPFRVQTDTGGPGIMMAATLAPNGSAACRSPWRPRRAQSPPPRAPIPCWNGCRTTA